MGRFNTVEIEVPLPDGFAGELRTKDFDSVLSTILIRSDGRLMEKMRRLEPVPPSERPSSNDPGTQIFGWMRMVNLGWRDLDFHGDFEFYGHDENGRHFYRARFTHGQLEWIRLQEGDGVVPSDV